MDLDEIKENFYDDKNRVIFIEDSNIAVYKKVKSSNIFAPYNKAALDFEISMLDKFYQDKFKTNKFQFLDKEEKTKIYNKYIDLRKNFNRINIKNRGKIKLSKEFLAYDLGYKTLKPLNNTSKKELFNLSLLRNYSVSYNKEIWDEITSNWLNFLK